MTTKIYYNSSKDKMNIIGIGELKAGEQISLTTQYQPTVILENYPGLVDVTAAEEAGTWEAPVSKPTAPELPTNLGAKNE